MAPDLDDPALVEGQGAEGAGPEAAPVGDQTEFDFLDGRHTSGLFVAGVVGAHVGKIVDRVHFFGGQRLLGWILNHIAIAIGLCQAFGGEGITVAVLDLKGLGVAAPVGLHFLKRGQHNGGQAVVQLRSFEHGAVDVGDVLGLHPGVQGVGDLQDALFPHAVHEQVRLAVQQNGALHALGPVVVMA